ncbi:MAG TPA: trypsin-like peptidase domain-containing protein [Ferruginibacter sp.]|nr:trypsin-like peptidase domain-containing protein [Ferruginibacter sp.]
MKKQLKILTFVIGTILVMAGFTLFAKNNNNRTALQTDSIPAYKTNYTNNITPPVDFENAATQAVPSVVHIKTVTKASQVSGRSQNPFGNMFGDDDLFKRFFGGSGTMVVPDQRASGSGVIISKDGYIVTNNHVIDGATEITVTLNDRKNYKAKVIGTDANTDLAIIKIDGDNLPVMSIGNSDDVHLGQWVLAIGYPLNLDVTVTQGIVSAKSRNIGINQQGAAPVEAFIQTDAAVNPGSSGGALVNTGGQLIGITSAIASPTGSYAGYAYSIPANLMKKVVNDIMKYGSVQRGFLGISMAPENLDNAKKKELGINDDIDGVWVIETDPTGAAAEAGIKKGDAIIKINADAVTTGSELSEIIARHKPGDNLSITYMRGNQEKTVTVTLKNKLGSFPSQRDAAIKSLGAAFTAVSKEEAAKLGIAGGVKVGKIGEGIINDQTTIKPGFIITKVGDEVVKSPDDLKQALSKQENNFQIEGIYPGKKQVYYYGINDFKK